MFRLAELVVEFVLKGQAEVREALDSLKNLTATYGDVIAKVGGPISERYEAIQAALANTLQTKLARNTKAATEEMIKHAAAVAGVTEQEFRALVAQEEHNKALEKSVALAKEARDKVKAGVQTLIDSAVSAGRALGGMAATGIGALMAIGRAGFASSAWGQQFAIQMEMLSRGVAGLFGPEIRKVLEMIQRLTQWLYNLTDAQRESISRWVKIAAVVASLAIGINPLLTVLTLVLAGANDLHPAFKRIFDQVALLGQNVAKAMEPMIEVLGAMLPPIIDFVATALSKLNAILDSMPGRLVLLAIAVGIAGAAIAKATLATWAFVKAQIAKLAFTGPAGWALLAGGALALAAALTSLTDAQQRGSTGGRGAAPPRFNGFETDQTAAYFRAATEAINSTMGRDNHERQVERRLENIENGIRDVVTGVQRIQPAIVRN